jgi:hypothetical protein
LLLLFAGALRPLELATGDRDRPLLLAVEVRCLGDDRAEDGKRDRFPDERTVDEREEAPDDRMVEREREPLADDLDPPKERDWLDRKELEKRAAVPDDGRELFREEELDDGRE